MCLRNWFKDCGVFFLFVCVMANVIGLAGNCMEATSDAFLNFLLNIFDSFIIATLAWAVGMLFGKHRTVARIARCILFGVVATFLYSELFTVFFYHSLISVHVVQLVMETNGGESSEFISAALSSSATWYALAITLGVAILSAAIGRLMGMIPQGKVQKVCLFLFFGLVIWSGTRQIPGYFKVAKCFFMDRSTECARMMDNIHLNTPAVRILFGMAFNKASTAELAILERSVQNTKVDGCSTRCPLIILVIGESYNKYHSHLYNKDYLPTTPYLDSLAARGNLVAYSDAMTPYNMTTHVFRHLFSTVDRNGEKVGEQDDDWTNHSLFSAIFKKAGYDVYFVTNQFVADDNDNWNAMGGTFLNNKRLSDMQFTWRNTYAYRYDDELLAEVPSLERLKTRPSLLIVHLIGQHVSYSERYPEEFRRFTPADSKTQHGGDEGKRIEAHYANATFYNDFVVGSLLSRFAEEDVIGIYLSDHGEEVYDWRDCYERTHEDPIPDEVKRYQYEIPLMFYMTDTFRTAHPDVADRVEKAKDLPVVNSNLCHSLLWLAGISTPEYREELDFLSPAYDDKRERKLWD